MKTGADVLGMPIESDDGRSIGTVMDLPFDDRCSRVLGLVMRSGYVFRTRQVVGFSEVRQFVPTPWWSLVRIRAVRIRMRWLP